MTNQEDDAGQQIIDQEIIVRSLTKLFVDEEGVPLIDYASTLHQLSQGDDDCFRSPEEDCNPVSDFHFSDAREFWKVFRISDDLSKPEIEALKSEIKFQHQRAKKAPKTTRRKSSVRRRKMYRADNTTSNFEMEGTMDALVSPTTTTTRLRVRKVSKLTKDEVNDGPNSSRGRSPNPKSLPRRGSSGSRRSISAPRRKESDQEIPKTPKSPKERASSRSIGRTRRLSIGKSPRKIYDSNEETEEGLVDNAPELVTESPPEKLSQVYLSSGDVEKIKQAMAVRNVKSLPVEEKAKGSWLNTPKALINMAMPGSSRSSSPGTKSPRGYKHQHDVVISWVRIAPAKSSKKTQRRLSATPPTHSRNNSGDLTPHARQLQTIPMGSLFSFKSEYDK